MAGPLSRSYRSCAAAPLAVREVLVSQSRDLARNTALEDWAVRHLNLRAKNVLILSNNLSVSPDNMTVLDIKATLLDADVMAKAAKFEELVLASIPGSLMLGALPDLARGRQLLEDGALGHTVRLPLHREAKAKEVLEALHAIATNFLGEDRLQRISLVRPDGGWFKGLEPVRHELESELAAGSRLLAQSARWEPPRAGGRGGRHREEGLQNSYGI